jgi:hypothetical protein
LLSRRTARTASPGGRKDTTRASRSRGRAAAVAATYAFAGIGSRPAGRGAWRRSEGGGAAQRGAAGCAAGAHLAVLQPPERPSRATRPFQSVG